MPTTLTVEAIEGGTYAITATFRDEDDVAVAPDSMAWSLVDRRGNVVNEKGSVAVDPLASTVVIVLSGDDVALADPGMPDRVVVFEGTYTGTLGTKPMRDEVRFKIQNLALPSDT